MVVDKQTLVWIIVSLLGVLELHVVQADTQTVKIKNGTLVGLKMESRLGRKFISFRGIPYAKPPLGELRFEPPVPPAAWEGKRSAQDNADICTQRNIYTHQEEIVGVEDCLYLNVYTPRLPPCKDKESVPGFPVMIWFHGGGWVTGAGHSDFYGPKFLLDHDVILVTVNFRLGPLGFLSTEDLVVPGNQGMKDQAQSIRWVHENIVAFGGDPNRVTIFGESAGGASVNYHMISPLSKGLFHRGISQSGTGYCPWTLTRPGTARPKAFRVGELLNCPTGNSKELIECLRTKDAVDIIGTDRAFQVYDYCPMIPFRPVVEPKHLGAFLTEDPVTSSQEGRVADLPWMTGITSEEGTLRVPSLYGLFNGDLIKQMNDDFHNVAPITLLYEETCPKYLKDKISDAIREFYFGENAIDNGTRFSVIDMYSDAWFDHAAVQSVRDYLRTQSSPLYFYYFAYRGTSSFSRIFGDPTQDYGVSHADDLQYLFPVGDQLWPDTPLSKEDHKYVDLMTSLWYNFAKSGNPTPEITKAVPVKWKPVRTSALEYLHISQPTIRMSENPLPERVAFWDTLPIRPDVKVKGKFEDNIKQEL